jgi:hypothetical protein
LRRLKSEHEGKVADIAEAGLHERRPKDRSHNGNRRITTQIAETGLHERRPNGVLHRVKVLQGYDCQSRTPAEETESRSSK